MVGGPEPPGVPFIPPALSFLHDANVIASNPASKKQFFNYKIFFICLFYLNAYGTGAATRLGSVADSDTGTGKKKFASVGVSLFE